MSMSIPEAICPTHLLLSARKRKYFYWASKDPNVMDALPDIESDNYSPSAGIEEETGSGEQYQSPSLGDDSRAGHPRAPHTTIHKCKASTLTGDARYVL